MSSSELFSAESGEVAAFRRLVAACAQFEAEWRAGQAPRIETYLHSVDPEQQEQLLRELLALELELRLSQGDHPQLQDYIDRNPAWAAVAAQVFEEQHMSAQPPASTVTGQASTLAATGALASVGACPDPTISIYETPGPSQQSETPIEVPDRLGRYTITGALGGGGGGRVFLARDDDLDRLVAIKVPKIDAPDSPQLQEQFLAEARLAGGLNHTAIVRIYDVGYAEGHGVFVVMEYIQGRTFSELIKNDRPTPTRLAELMIVIAEAAHFAHKAGLVHRDLKPSNILLDARGEPHIADFGLAMRDSLQHRRSGEIAGTPPYMSPEQVRGEAHRLDGRTDIWAMGVMLYQGLLQRLPFTGRSRTEVFDEVLHRDPKPPRQIDDRIPRGLERICMKCLAKRMGDRYQTAADLADDLKSWLVSEASTDTASPTPTLGKSAAGSAPLVVPKGLRAFDIEDADFFLTLLPGPRDREGLPESLRAWKNRVEEQDAGKAIAVGLLYGPSGCGKSSLIRAGLIPRLSRLVRPVYVEASPASTEARLLAALHRSVAGLPADCTLAEATAAIRETAAHRGGAKVLVVIDQFEQWLHSHPDEPEAELVRALRQCDGVGLQALVLVRDDFWMAITRFFRALELPLEEGVNSAAVELFDAQHARRVLAEFGRALGRLGTGTGTGTGTGSDAANGDEARFLDQAIRELTGPDGRIIPVRLTLFAEMIRHREWTPATLKELGGIEGIGVTFLEETFCARSAPPAHRLHAPAAQQVLKSLLPEATSDLKGKQQSRTALQAASGYADRPHEFAELIRMLDTELRMVTPVDPSGAAPAGAGHAGPGAETCYQLSHDYLVPVLRQWLTRKQRETRRGRAELRLGAITALWRERPESRTLPSLWEWIDIRWHTRPGTWSPDERRLMRAAGQHYLVRTAAALFVLGVLGYGALAYRERSRASAAVASALKADFRHLPDLLPKLSKYRDYVRPDLQAVEEDTSATAREREVAGLVLYREWPTPGRAAALRGHLLRAEPDEAEVVIRALALHPDPGTHRELMHDVLDESLEPATRLRVACALAALTPGRSADWQAAAPALAQALLTEDRRTVPRWQALLGPTFEMLEPELARACRDPGRDPTTRTTAAEALGDGLARRAQAETLARLVVESLPESSRTLLHTLGDLRERDQGVAYLRSVLDERSESPRDDPARTEQRAHRQATAAVALATLGSPEVLWPLLRHNDDPRVRSLLIQELAGSDLATRIVIDRLRLPDLDPTERQALLLVWAEAGKKNLPGDAHTAVRDLARRLFASDPHRGVHSAAELVLRLWDDQHGLAQGDEQSAPLAPDQREWYLGPNGHTFVVLSGPLRMRMGSPPGEYEREELEDLHWRQIDRGLAVATKETTFAQLSRFLPAHDQDLRNGPQPDCPANKVTWFEAAAYCNWLSEQARLPQSEWCYPVRVCSGMTLDPAAVERTGYRLPTEAEWEYLARAGTVTAYSFGETDELLPYHGWTWLNSRNRTSLVGLLQPNEFGLFDVHGNVWEWCHDGPFTEQKETYPRYPQGTAEHRAGDPMVKQVLMGDVESSTITWRLARGGAYDYAPSMSRSAKRYLARVTLTHPYMGFRVVRTLPRSATAAAGGRLEGVD